MNSVINWHNYFTYDESSPSCLRWKHAGYRGAGYKVKFRDAGDVAGGLEKEGYWQVNCEKKSFRVNKVVWEMFNPDQPSISPVDHENKLRVDNRISNLRLVSYALNRRNSKLPANNTSGVMGVCLSTDSRSGLQYWTTTWRSLCGKQRKKNFSCLKVGSEKAFRAACEFRKQVIAEMNLAGAGYTSTHGGLV